MFEDADEKEYIDSLLTKIENQNIRSYTKTQMYCFFEKNTNYKDCHHGLNILSIVSLACIPIFNTFENCIHKETIISIASTISIISLSINSLYNFKNSWIRYRNTLEELKNECVLYINSTPPYNRSDKDDSFLKKIIEISNKENSSWNIMQNKH